MNDGPTCETLWDGKHSPGDLTLVSRPSHGSVELEGNRYTYIPAPAFIGSDSFRLEAPSSHSIHVDVTVLPPGSDVSGPRLRRDTVSALAKSLDPTDLPGPNPPPPPRFGLAPTEKPTPWIGLYVESVGSYDASRLGLPSPVGLLVKSVDGGGPAEKAGLRPDDVVFAFNGTRLLDPPSLHRAVQAASIGDAATIEFWRNRQFKNVQVEMGQARTPVGHAGPAG